jgi:hypothetical protein
MFGSVERRTDAERHNFWIHEDILHEQPVLKTAPALKDTQGGPAYTGFALGTLLDYWRAVEPSTLTHLPRANGRRVETDRDCARPPAERFTVDGLLCAS